MDGLANGDEGFDLNHWLRSESVASFLTIPLLNNLKRKTKNTNEGSHVLYRPQGSLQVLADLDQVHDYLMENKIEIPISFFTFDPEILVNTRRATDPDLVYIKDLSKGQERIPIPVICQKRIDPGKLAKYLTKPIFSKALLKTNTLSYEHDDGFLVCCQCPNDCKDKMKCPCFLKTLDNCSEKTRREVGDEKIGYNYQRLEQSFLSGIFECNKLCQCHKQTCFNRVVQNGMVCKLEMFMTGKKGWGVRTVVDIPKGTFICTYTGKIVGADYAEEVSKCWNSGKWKFLSELRLGEEGKEGYEEEVVEPDCEDAPIPAIPVVEDNNQVTSLASEAMEASQKLSHTEEVKEPDFVGGSVVNENKENSSVLVSNWLESKTNDLDRSSPQTTSRIKRVKAPSPSDRLLRHQVEPEIDWRVDYSRRIFPNVRSDKELTLLENLTFQSMTTSMIPVTPCSAVPLRWTQFVFRKDLEKFGSPRGPVENETNKIVRSDRKRLKNFNNQTTRISRQRTQQKQIAKRLKRTKALFGIRRKVTKRPSTKKRPGAGSQAERVHQLLDLSLSIDGINYKNVGGYLNHSCSPNVFPQYVFWDCHDLRLPVIAFFASKNILRGEELCWNYKYESEEFLKGEEEHQRNQRRLPCHCNADNCRRTMYTC